MSEENKAPEQTTNAPGAEQPVKGKAAPAKKKWTETYWKVKFHPRSSTVETEEVELTVNGEVLIIQRGEVVIIPGRFKECAEHTLVQKFRQLPNEPRKDLTPIMLYPFETIGEANEAEFFKMRQEGTQKMKDDIQRHGFRESGD